MRCRPEPPRQRADVQRVHAPLAQERDLKFTLDFIPLGRHAPWYVALAKGYYKDEGLNVTIVPARGTADSIRAVDSGIADLGFIDIPSLVAAGADASTIRMVAVNYQQPPYSVFSLDPGANITKPQDMAGKEFSAGNASLIPRIHQAFMRQNGVDPSTLKIVNLDPASLLAPWRELRHRIDDVLDRAAGRPQQVPAIPLDEHPAPGCFVCGPRHPEGLNLQPGSVDGTGTIATVMTIGSSAQAILRGQEPPRQALGDGMEPVADHRLGRLLQQLVHLGHRPARHGLHRRT